MYKKTSKKKSIQKKRKLSSNFTRQISSSLSNTINFKHSDVSIALNILHQQFPYLDPIPPLMTLHQLYHLIENRTLVDKTINQMAQQNILRYILLGNFKHGTEIAVLYTKDYNQAVLYLCNQLYDTSSSSTNVRKKGKKEQHNHQSSSLTLTLGMTIENQQKLKKEKLILIQYFLNNTLKLYWNVMVTKDQILNTCYYNTSYEFIKVNEVITILVQSQVILLRDANEKKGFYIRCPYIGTLLVDLQHARKKIRQIIKRTNYQSIQFTKLSKKVLKNQQFDISFYIKDMLGGNLLIQTKTTSNSTLITLPSSSNT